MPFGGIIVNRVHTLAVDAPWGDNRFLDRARSFLTTERGLPDMVSARLVENYVQYAKLAAQDNNVLRAFVESFPAKVAYPENPGFR